MGFAQDIQNIRPKIDILTKAMSGLTDDKIRAIEKLSKYDLELLEKIVTASEKIQDARKDVLLVENGLQDIRRVVEMQNQVHFVSDARDNIGLVAGNILEVQDVAEDIVYVRATSTMLPMIKEVLNLSTKMDLVLDMEESINKFINESDLADEKIARMNDLAIQASNSAKLAVDMVNKSNAIEKRIDAKLKRVEELADNLTNLTIEYVSIPHTEPAKMSYVDNELVLYIPAGKPGPKVRIKVRKETQETMVRILRLCIKVRSITWQNMGTIRLELPSLV